MKKLILGFLAFSTFLNAQEKPKLVVGIVVDQMKMEYLYRFSNDFSNKGFKKLMGKGSMSFTVKEVKNFTSKPLCPE